jgi:hypothetical protein
VVDELCAGAPDGLPGGVGLDGLDGLVGGAGFDGVCEEEFPWLALFPGAEGTVVLVLPVFAFGPFFGPCAFGGRWPVSGPWPCVLGFCDGTDGTGFEPWPEFDGEVFTW